jgi:hypothetical protein
MDRFGLDLGVHVAGGGVCSGAQRLWPLRPSCSGEGGSGEACERAASFGGCKGR